MYNLNKYKSQYIGYNKIDIIRMAVHSINTSCHRVQILECNGTVLLHNNLYFVLETWDTTRRYISLHT